jgi:hypothetical protein
VNNLLKIMSLDEETAQGVVFARDRFEGGINFIFDPSQSKFEYQVFIHKDLPLQETQSWRFESFSLARHFAADVFGKDWEMLVWDHKVKRPCEDGGHECGSGKCETCQSMGGGCTSCGAVESV